MEYVKQNENKEEYFMKENMFAEKSYENRKGSDREFIRFLLGEPDPDYVDYLYKKDREKELEKDPMEQFECTKEQFEKRLEKTRINMYLDTARYIDRIVANGDFSYIGFKYKVNMLNLDHVAMDERGEELRYIMTLLGAEKIEDENIAAEIELIRAKLDKWFVRPEDVKKEPVRQAEKKPSSAELLEEYQKLGTVEEFKELKEKNTAKIPHFSGDGCWNGQIVYDTYECPGCGKEYELDYEEYDYCPKCGQRMKIAFAEE